MVRPAFPSRSATDQGFFYEGDRRGVLLIHGMTGTPKEMKIVGKGLAAAGFTVHGVQLAGHCGTEKDLIRTGWRDWYGSVEQAFDALRGRCDQVFAAGLSAGALLALHLAWHRREQVAGLALYSTTLTYDGWAVTRGSFLLPLVLRIPWLSLCRFSENPPYGIKDERLRRKIISQMVSGNSAEAGLWKIPGRSIRQMHQLRAVVKRELPGIATPTLVIHSSEDDVASVKNAEMLEQRLRGPVKKVLLGDCYHLITVDREREEVVRETAMFFESLSRSKAATDAGRTMEAGRP